MKERILELLTQSGSSPLSSPNDPEIYPTKYTV
jgi:hypothetical protein